MSPSHPFLCVVCAHMTIQEILLFPTDMKVFMLLDCKKICIRVNIFFYLVLRISYSSCMPYTVLASGSLIRTDQFGLLSPRSSQSDGNMPIHK